MGHMVDKIAVAARSQAKTVLLMGESGTGKAIIARLLHDESARKAEPFVEINCAAIPGTLFESQLFGHEKGAFTDAREAQVGLIRLAEGGTLFLDEIGEMPLELQSKLLQFLESQRFRPVGGRREYSADVRIVAATNRDLQLDVKEGRFRSDLFYRLNVVPFTIPPLRERAEDLTLLLEHFIESSARKEGVTPIHISPQVMQIMQGYGWPGNVRELKNLIERWTILHPGESITPAELPPDMNGGDVLQGTRAVSLGDGSIEDVLDRIERQLIDQALAATHGHRGLTAEKLGISRHALKRRMQRLGMQDDA
jgi:DNA-binding NtrC family response regulator